MKIPVIFLPDIKSKNKIEMSVNIPKCAKCGKEFNPPKDYWKKL